MTLYLLNFDELAFGKLEPERFLAHIIIACTDTMKQ